eukprot:TRINITY_DN10528_c0_g1_i1.p1 TRINITY_DN10528_c0_g1~~TRINITY_DN10528_c0_g1_i1.p1  ORF type:complete len:435 (-),score=121.90 TRINITY_DN10528_c0_g1_i1:57-1328(-)
MSNCWVEYDESTPFPIQNLPYGVFKLINEDAAQARAGVAIGDYVLDLAQLQQNGLFDPLLGSCFSEPGLNEFMSLGREAWVSARSTITDLLTGENPALKDNEELKNSALIPLSNTENLLPARIGDYTDFYSSREHATNMGKIFRPNEAALKPNWVWLPVGYHGRASSVVLSGTEIRRPNGQIKARDSPAPTVKACGKLDFELEMAFFVGPGNNLGDPITIQNAEDHIFGVVLMNDWSARDIQGWEYVPLGPFNGKNFGTSITPWIITLDALEPFRVPGPEKDPATLDYLTDTTDAAYDIHLEVLLQSEKMAQNDIEPAKISESNFKYLYWSMKQQLVHHSVTGCNMSPGDLLGSGTISGPGDMYGSFMELSWNGSREVELPTGETRAWLEDGDNIILDGWAQGDGYRVGFGPCFGPVLPAHPL